MKRVFVMIVLAGLLACNNQRKETIDSTEITSDSVVAEKEASNYNAESDLYVWKSSPDYTKEKNPAMRKEILHVDSLLLGLNQLNENVFIEKLKISGDTLYTEIKDSQYLGEQMGTTGAEMYLADVVLNLTEVPGVKFVNIQMEERSHIQPGTWSKENFAKYKPIN